MSHPTQPALDSTDSTDSTVIDQELTDDSLESVAGGIIIVGGRSLLTRGTLVSLNPQPLPPRWSFSNWFRFN